MKRFLKCDNPKCNHIFEENEAGTYKEHHNEIEGDFYETFLCCPVCGCPDVYDVDDPNEENEEIEDDESEIESFEYMIVVRYDSLQGYYRNAYFYASTLEEANATIEKYIKYKRVKAWRLYIIVDSGEIKMENSK